MRRIRSVALTIGVALLGASAPALGADACRAPAGVSVSGVSVSGVSISGDGVRSGDLDFPRGSEICMPRAPNPCFGCEPGFVHRCTSAGWQPIAGRTCETRRTATNDRGVLSDALAGTVSAVPVAPVGTVPFRHCRYFDADGTELRVPDEEARRARELGLIAWQRCETVYCRLFGEEGRPLNYAPDEQAFVRRDIEDGHVSVRASECFSVRDGRAGTAAYERR